MAWDFLKFVFLFALGAERDFVMMPLANKVLSIRLTQGLYTYPLGKKKAPQYRERDEERRKSANPMQN